MRPAPPRPGGGGAGGAPREGSSGAVNLITPSLYPALPGAPMIRFGPSGIPLSCKGRTLRDGIEDVHNLGLSAMEVQLVRVNVLERPAGDEEEGQTPRTLPGELVVEIRRKEDKKDVRIADLDAEIEAGGTPVSPARGPPGGHPKPPG